jgi:hypothetical protein
MQTVSKVNSNFFITLSPFLAWTQVLWRPIAVPVLDLIEQFILLAQALVRLSSLSRAEVKHAKLFAAHREAWHRVAYMITPFRGKAENRR